MCNNVNIQTSVATLNWAVKPCIQKENPMTENHVAYMSINQIAERLSITPVTIYRWIKQGRFPKGRLFSPGCRRWSVQEISDWEMASDTLRAA